MKFDPTQGSAPGAHPIGSGIARRGGIRHPRRNSLRVHA